MSRNGTLVYVPGGARPAGSQTLVWVDRKGHEEPIAAPPRAYVYSTPLARRDARRARHPRSAERHLDFGSRPPEPPALDERSGPNRLPVWTPDSKRVAFTAERDGVESVHWQAFDGSGTMERLSIGTQRQAPQAFSPDGTQLIFVQRPLDRRASSLIWASSPWGQTATRRCFCTRRRTKPTPRFRPTGVGSRTSPTNPGEKKSTCVRSRTWRRALHQVSTGGGTRPLWSRDGRELFYLVAPGHDHGGPRASRRGHRFWEARAGGQRDVYCP